MAAPTSDAGPSLAPTTADDRLARALGIRVDRPDPRAGEDAAVATFTGALAWSGGGDTARDDTAGDDTAGEDTVPTAALLALVDATARAAAGAAVSAPGRTATLVPAAAGVQFRAPLHGPVTATASVPRDRDLADRADDRGTVRFSVAVDVVGPDGARVASGTVQWVAHMSPCCSAEGAPGT